MFHKFLFIKIYFLVVVTAMLLAPASSILPIRPGPKNKTTPATPPFHHRPSPPNACLKPCFSFLPVLLLQTATATPTLSARAVCRDGGDVFNAPDLQPRTSQSTEGVLSTGTRGLGLVAACCSHLNVHCSDAQFLLVFEEGFNGLCIRRETKNQAFYAILTTYLALDCNVLGGKHSSIRGSLITISLHLHATRHTGQSLSA